MALIRVVGLAVILGWGLLMAAALDKNRAISPMGQVKDEDGGAGSRLGSWLGGVSIATWLLWVAIVTSAPRAVLRPWGADILAGMCLLGTVTSVASAVCFFNSRTKFKKTITVFAGLSIIVQLASFVRAFFMILDNN